MNISQVKYELVAIGDTIEDLKLVSFTLNGFPSSREPFI